MVRDGAPTILVVDDTTAMVVMIRRMLRELGFLGVGEAGDGEEALVKLSAHRYGLVLSDLRMPRMGGLELLRRVRANPALQTLPFIILTASHERDNVVAAKAAGCTDYIVKPFTTATLKLKVEHALGTQPA